MLTILQYFSLIAAFFLPWLIGGLIKFHRTGETKKRNLCLLLLLVCLAAIGLTVYLAFAIQPAL